MQYEVIYWIVFWEYKNKNKNFTNFPTMASIKVFFFFTESIFKLKKKMLTFKSEEIVFQ